MKCISAYLSLMVCLSSVPAASQSVPDLWNKFIAPEDECRTKVWWFHGETETTREGIDLDLEAFKDKGVGGVVFYDQVHSKAEGASDSMSPEWWDCLKYAARRSNELGLSFELAASNGYVAGGPWITPELSMKKTCFTDTLVTAGSDGVISLQLATPGKNFHDIAVVMFHDTSDYEDLQMLRSGKTVFDNASLSISYDAGRNRSVRGITYWVSPRGKGSTGSMNIPGKPQERYFGAKYIELPPIGELEYSLDGISWKKAVTMTGIESVIGHKSRERSISFPEVCGRYFRVNIHDWLGEMKELNKLIVSDISLSTRDITDNWQVKAGLRTEVLYPTETGGDVGAIPLDRIRDVSRDMDSDGNLRLKVAPGTWRIVRVGWIPTGAKTKHGRKNLLGYECDVMSAEAARIHYNSYFKTILDSLGTAGCKIDGMCMDSHEGGIQNWTAGFEDRFERANGYSLIPWLPVLAGYIVNDREATERTLLDFRKTIASVIASDFYGTFGRLCEADGVNFTSQAMLNIDNDNIASRGMATKPQGEFWAYQKDGNYDCLDAASAAHLYDKPIASGEAFTDTPYESTWDELLRIANLAYCRGINEFAVCASSYQPWADRRYNDSLSAHPYVFHRHHHDWEASKSFWEYQARCASLLRVGVPIVDLCIYIGEDLPLKTMAYKLPQIPEGYNFDVCTYDGLMHRLRPENGRLVTHGGMSYKVLVVQDRTYLSPEVIKTINRMESEGVPVVWCNKGEDLDFKLQKFGIEPDLSIKSVGKPDDTVCFFHRRTADREIYFIYNHSRDEFSQTVSTRQNIRQPEFWNPKTLERKPLATSGNGRSVEIKLKPYEAVFLIAYR